MCITSTEYDRYVKLRHNKNNVIIIHNNMFFDLIDFFLSGNKSKMSNCKWNVKLIKKIPVHTRALQDKIYIFIPPKSLLGFKVFCHFYCHYRKFTFFCRTPNLETVSIWGLSDLEDICLYMCYYSLFGPFRIVTYLMFFYIPNSVYHAKYIFHYDHTILFLLGSTHGVSFVVFHYSRTLIIKRIRGVVLKYDFWYRTQYYVHGFIDRILTVKSYIIRRMTRRISQDTFFQIT